jgi:plastocyanin
MKRVLALAVALMLTVIGCDGGDGGDGDGGDGGTTTTEAAAASETVEIADLAFTPAELTVAVGTEVTWVNNDANLSHTATSDDEVFDSGNLSEGDEFSSTFDEAGTFPYFCQVHPTMRGTIIVE